MIDSSLDKLELVAKNRNIKDYENKSEKELRKILNKKTTRICKKIKKKLEEMKRKLEEIKKCFSKLRHKFCKEEIDKFRKRFYVIENHQKFYAAEIKKAIKNFTELEKILQFKKFHDEDYNNE